MNLSGAIPYKYDLKLRRSQANALLVASMVALSGLAWNDASAQNSGSTNRVVTAPKTKHATHQNPHLKEGISLYKRGDYRGSMSEFALALNSEFSNATLHYYMANALIGMRQRESAIREFRIAYALAPREEPGMLSHLALSYMDADNYDDNVTKKPEAPKVGAKPEPKVDPVFEKSLELLKRQAADAAFDVKNLSPKDADMIRLHDENIAKSRNAIVDALLKANPDDLHLSGEALSHLNRTKQLVEERNRRMGNIGKKVSSVTDSAASLQTLMQEKNSKSAPRLDPRGTNLYIRNYKAPTSKSETLPTK